MEGRGGRDQNRYPTLSAIKAALKALAGGNGLEGNVGWAADTVTKETTISDSTLGIRVDATTVAPWGQAQAGEPLLLRKMTLRQVKNMVDSTLPKCCDCSFVFMRDQIRFGWFKNTSRFETAGYETTGLKGLSDCDELEYCSLIEDIFEAVEQDEILPCAIHITASFGVLVEPLEGEGDDEDADDEEAQGAGMDGGVQAIQGPFGGIATWSRSHAGGKQFPAPGQGFDTTGDLFPFGRQQQTQIPPGHHGAGSPQAKRKRLDEMTGGSNMLGTTAPFKFNQSATPAPAASVVDFNGGRPLGMFAGNDRLDELIQLLGYNFAETYDTGFNRLQLPLGAGAHFSPNPIGVQGQCGVNTLFSLDHNRISVKEEQTPTNNFFGAPAPPSNGFMEMKPNNGGRVDNSSRIRGHTPLRQRGREVVSTKGNIMEEAAMRVKQLHREVQALEGEVEEAGRQYRARVASLGAEIDAKKAHLKRAQDALLDRAQHSEEESPTV